MLMVMKLFFKLPDNKSLFLQQPVNGYEIMFEKYCQTNRRELKYNLKNIRKGYMVWISLCQYYTY